MITWISLLILAISAQLNGIEAQKATSLASKIQELAPIARLTNGIALETELLTDPKKTNDVVAEFLGMQSGDDLVKLKGMDVDGVVTGLGEIYSAVKLVPDMNVDVQAFKDSFEALDKMKEYADVLNDTSGNDVTGIGSDIANARRLSGTITDIDSFQKAADNLRIISENNIHININDAMKGQLFPLKTAINKMKNPLVIFQNFAQNFAKLLHLHNSTTRLSGLANVSELLIANLNTLSIMNSELTALKSGVDQLKPVIDKQKTIPQLTKTMQDTINIIKTATHLTPEMKLTIGFSGDPNMIAEMFQDLKATHLKKIVSKGKDLNGMADSLKILPKFQSKMQTVHRVWSAAMPDNWTSANEAVQVFSDMSVTNQNAPDTLTVSTTLGSIQQCFGSFQNPNTIPSLNEVSAISTFASNLSQQILEWKTFFDEKQSDFSSLDNYLGNLETILKPINHDPKNPKRQEVWNSIKNQTDNMKTVSILESVHEGLDRLWKNSPFTTIDSATPDLTVISDIVSSLNEVNLPSLLTCVAAQEAGLPDITTMLTIGSSVQAMKTKEPSFALLKKLFAEVLKVKSGVVDIGKTMVSAKRRRRRGAASSKSLKNLKNAQEASYNLGLGIQVLHKFVEILEKQDSVRVAVDAVDPLASTVAAVPGSQTVWANRKSMGVMIDDLNKLERTAGNLKKDNLADLWKVFAEANLVPGVSINATLFDDPISKQLAQNSDPTIQAKSSDFKEIGSLDLNFVQHLVNLQKASQTLAPLQAFFDDYFDNKPGGQGSAGIGFFGEGSFPIGTIALAVFFFLLFAGVAGAGVYFVMKHFREKRLWETRELQWMYSNMLEAGDQMNTAVRNNLFLEAKKLLKHGRYVDEYAEYEIDEKSVSATPLYSAVDLGKPEFVEMLIRGGADRSLRSSDGLTPQELLKKKLEQLALKNKEKVESQNETQKGEETQEGKTKDQKEKTKGKTKKSKKEEPVEDVEVNSKNPVKLQEIEQIFKKYEKKKFRPKICDSIRLEKFRIDVRKGAKDETKFKEKYGQLVSVGATEVGLTHRVCKVDKDGVVDMEDLMERNAMTNSEIENIIYGFMDRSTLVNDSWLDACMKNKKNLYKDHEYRITKFRYNGKVYGTVDEWRKWVQCWAVPCLFNVRVAYVLEGHNPLEGVDARKEGKIKLSEDKILKLRVAIHFMDCLLAILSAERMEVVNLIMDSSKRNNKRPYWFPEMNCHWVLYPAAEKANFDVVWLETKKLCEKVDQATPFVIMTFEEFFDKLLSLNGYKDLLAAKYPKDGGEQKKGTAKSKDRNQKPKKEKAVKDKKPTKGSTDQTKSKSTGSGSTQASAQGSITKSTTAAETSKV